MILREVTNLPSRPINGLSFTRKSIVKVGSSTWIGGSGIDPSPHTVSPTKISLIPAIVTTSPDIASCFSTLVSHNVVNTLEILPFLCDPSLP